MDSIFERTESIKNQLIRLCDTAIVGYCYWYESMGRQFGLHITPLTVADKFGEQLNNKEAAWILLQPLLKSVALLIISVSALVLSKQNKNSSQSF